MSSSKEGQCQLQRGEYLGEVSALCFLHLPLSSLPLLLAGTGSQILVYDLADPAKVVAACFQVFEGIRVHGMSLELSPSHSTPFKIALAVYGERRVKLFHLRIHSQNQPHPSSSSSSCDFQLTLLHSLPKFSHWVLDVCFLKENGATSSPCLAVGCSDNSLSFWDISACHVVSQVASADRCLLYSMRMWGDNIESLQVASGTIFNEIIVWKVNFPNHPPVLCGSFEISTTDEDSKLSVQLYQAVRICRLTGHEGSIFRISWSSDGLHLVSVSDDRSARVWTIDSTREGFSNLEDGHHFDHPVLFGHHARVWDCCIFDHLVITAGEDCTCRVWGPDGILLRAIKEHIGRGVWRCLYDPNSSLLVTAGFDSAIKVHQLQASSSNNSKKDLVDRNEVFTICLPNSSGHIGLTDSTSEYVRCLQFSREDSLYVATNSGYLYHAKLIDNGGVKWNELICVGERAPIICMDLLTSCSTHLGCTEDWIAVGDGKGSMMVVHVVGDIWSPKIDLTLTWSAELERQLLGTYWCRSLGCRFIFTADPRGRLKLWRLCDPLASLSHGSPDAYLITEFVSCYGCRIICLDASFQEEVLVCGDIRGNILLFPLSKAISSGSSVASEAEIHPLRYFKGAHGISSVCSISIASSSLSQVEIYSTGQDGCICYFEHDRDWQNLEFIGMKIVKELSAIASVFSNAECNNDPERSQYAIGFTSSDFKMWNLTAEREVVKVSCGGWRRPHSYYIGNVPEMKNCFGFVKNEIIHIHRHWVHDNEWRMYPQNLHLQFHGREVHSLCFIIGDSECSSSKMQAISSKSGWIASGCEDGTVRLTMYEPGLKNWTTSKLLGEHVGGSAVRSLCLVSKLYTILLDPTYMRNGMYRQREALEEPEEIFLLISVGAKRVLTAWKQKFGTRNKREVICNEPCSRDENESYGSSSGALSLPITFQWLSTDMPAKYTTNEKRQNTENGIEVSSGGSTHLKACLADKFENDWRYLAVTAFLVKVADSSISACFVVVACSDATLTLRALLLPFRLWFDVAILTPLSSPVLALQHLIVSKNVPFDGNLYMVISGSTDGSIAFWDLSKAVENFMQQASSLELKSYTDNQKRPRTGRGSQGGRRWRSLGSHVFKKRTCDEHASGSHFQKGMHNGSVSVRRTLDKSGKGMQNHVVHQTSEMLYSEQSANACSQVRNDALIVSEEIADDSSLEICEIRPLHVLNNVHQSGVNCLYVSDFKHSTASENRPIHYVLSGGDDQALNCLRFELALKVESQNHQNSTEEIHFIDPLESDNNCINICQIQNYLMKFLSLDKLMSAHSSAVKGVWTDGNVVFSTGLDQRVRCWNFDQNGKLMERCHVVVSVPEPEALDARVCGRNHYQIAVAGRGMQMVEFFAS